MRRTATAGHRDARRDHRRRRQGRALVRVGQPRRARPSPTRTASTSRRDPNPQAGYGAGGPHFCLGANLARREIAVMFEELRNRLPNLQITGGARPPAERVHPRHQAHALRVEGRLSAWNRSSPTRRRIAATALAERTGVERHDAALGARVGLGRWSRRPRHEGGGAGGVQRPGLPPAGRRGPRRQRSARSPSARPGCSPSPGAPTTTRPATRWPWPTPCAPPPPPAAGWWCSRTPAAG